MKILHYVSDGYTELNSSNFRVIVPANAIMKSGKAQIRIRNIKDWLVQGPGTISDCTWADIIVLQRVLVSESIQHAQTWKNRGKAIVIDFDDDYRRIRPDNSAYKFWYRGKIDVKLQDGHEFQKIMQPLPIEQFQSGMQHVTAITTPSRLLCKDWERYAPAFYLPNYLDLDRYYDKYKKYDNGDDIIIAWGGSLSHIPSFSDSGVEIALSRLLKERKNVKLLILGDSRIKERFSSLPKDQLLFQHYVKFSEWPVVLGKYDIGIAPLSGEYDCRRSHLKVLEYIALGIPFVATSSSAYDDLSGARSGNFVMQGDLDKCDKTNEEGWYKLLRKTVDIIEPLMGMARVEKKRFRKIYDIDENVDSILSVYEQVLELT